MPRLPLSRALAVALPVLIGCVPPARLLPPAPAPLREPLPVGASFGHTWDAAIDHLARRGIPIRTIERASGIIVAEEMGIDPASALVYADCGYLTGAAAGSSPWGPGVPAQQGRRPIAAERGFYNILVRGDSVGSSVLVTVRWRVPEGSPAAADAMRAGGSIACATRGVWERELEASVRERAQGGASTRRAP